MNSGVEILENPELLDCSKPYGPTEEAAYLFVRVDRSSKLWSFHHDMPLAIFSLKIFCLCVFCNF